MVPENDKRTALLKQAEAIVSAGGAMTADERRQLARLSQVLPVVDEAPGPNWTAVDKTAGETGKVRHDA
jgi:hypothetical protein